MRRTLELQNFQNMTLYAAEGTRWTLIELFVQGSEGSTPGSGTLKCSLFPDGSFLLFSRTYGTANQSFHFETDFSGNSESTNMSVTTPTRPIVLLGKKGISLGMPSTPSGTITIRLTVIEEGT